MISLLVLTKANLPLFHILRQATPELELGRLNIGSRPSKRNPKGGVESLRAIPWTFAWAQTRMHLSAWLGKQNLSTWFSTLDLDLILFGLSLLYLLSL